MNNVRELPWPHLILDNFLPKVILTKGINEIDSDNYNFEIENRGAGRIEFSLLKSKTLWRAVYSKNTVSLLSKAFDVNIKLNKHNLLQLRRMNEETPNFPIHNDFTSDGDTIASFLYISSGWSKECGGYLHLFEGQEQSSPSFSIAPIQNRFVAFRTDASHWHSVERVSGWERLSILALWDVDNSGAS